MKGQKLVEKMLLDFCTTRDRNASWKIVQDNRFWFTYLLLKSDHQFNILCTVCYISMQRLFWNRSEGRRVVARRNINCSETLHGLRLFNAPVSQIEEERLQRRLGTNFPSVKNGSNFHGSSNRLESSLYLYVCMIFYQGDLHGNREICQEIGPRECNAGTGTRRMFAS